MVIYSVISDYDLFYAQDREASYARDMPQAKMLSSLPDTSLTKPDVYIKSFYPKGVSAFLPRGTHNNEHF